MFIARIHIRTGILLSTDIIQFIKYTAAAAYLLHSILVHSAITSFYYTHSISQAMCTLYSICVWPFKYFLVNVHEHRARPSWPPKQPCRAMPLPCRTHTHAHTPTDRTQARTLHFSISKNYQRLAFSFLSV